MAKIIKIGSQNTTLTSKTARAGAHTNPFKFQDFEGNTLPPIEFADVFEGSGAKHTNKLRMIASSVTGSMNKFRSSITEPIMNFVNRVRNGISSAWDYAKNTNVSDLAPVKAINDVMNTQVSLGPLDKLEAPIRAIGNVMNAPVPLGPLDRLENPMSTIKNGISSSIEFLNKDVSEIGRGISEKMEFLNTDVSDIAKGVSSRMSFLNNDVTDLAKNMSDSWNSLISKTQPVRYTKEMPVSSLREAWILENSNESMEGARA